MGNVRYSLLGAILIRMTNGSQMDPQTFLIQSVNSAASTRRRPVLRGGGYTLPFSPKSKSVTHIRVVPFTLLVNVNLD